MQKNLDPQILLINTAEVFATMAMILAGTLVLTFLLRIFLRKTPHRLTATLLFPGLLGLLVLTVIPIGYEVYLSFSNMTSLVQDGKDYFKNPDFGVVYLLEHLRVLFSGPGVLLGIASNLLYAVGQVAAQLVMALVLGYLLDRPLKGKGIYRMFLALPWAIPSLVTIITWQAEFHYKYGIFNHIVKLLGHAPISWWDEPVLAFWITQAIVLWYTYPFLFLVVSGALETVPKEFHEAAEVDGANRFWRFTHISVPLIMPMLGPALVLVFIWTFNNANPAVMLPGAPPTMTAWVLWSFTQTPIRFGQAAAMSLVIFFFLFVFSTLAHRWLNSKDMEQRS